MKSISDDSVQAEEARIRQAYAKRQQDDQRYSWLTPSYLFMVHERERRFLSLLKRQGLQPLATKKILEIGCGRGYWLREFIKWGARPENVTGVDLLPHRIEEARELCPESINLYAGNVAKLSFPDSAYDLVLQSTVFTSVLDPGLKQQMASEMLRVLKTDGLILWYDYHVNNHRNPDVRGVKKAEIRQLFHSCQIELRRITLAPPITRLIAPHSWLVCYLLERVPWLCTHYLGVIRKRYTDERPSVAEALLVIC